MFCIKCGTRLPAEARFCLACGCDLGAIGSSADGSGSRDNSGPHRIPPESPAVAGAPEAVGKRVQESLKWYVRYLQKADDHLRATLDNIRRELAEDGTESQVTESPDLGESLDERRAQ